MHEHTSSSILPYSRETLDQQRLEEAHLKFCLLDVLKQYPKLLPEWKVHTEFSETLDIVIPLYYNAFTRRYAGKETTFCFF